jgi:hypothetical protein
VRKRKNVDVNSSEIGIFMFSLVSRDCNLVWAKGTTRVGLWQSFGVSFNERKIFHGEILRSFFNHIKAIFVGLFD